MTKRRETKVENLLPKLGTGMVIARTYLDAEGDTVVERIDEREFFDMSDLVAPEFGPGDPNIVIEPKAPTVEATRSADGTIRVKRETFRVHGPLIRGFDELTSGQQAYVAGLLARFVNRMEGQKLSRTSNPEDVRDFYNDLIERVGRHPALATPPTSRLAG